MRLTEKNELAAFTSLKYLPKKPIYLDYNKGDAKTVEALLNKLGKLEDIEEELEIDLITLVKALTSDVFLYHNETLTKCEQAPLLLCFDGEYCLEYHFDKDIEQVYLKHYGKTWALTRQELEH